MSEQLHGDNSLVFRRCFEPIEQAASLSPLASADAYEMYDTFLVEHDLDPIIYMSMAITSGGFRRDPDLGEADVIARNSKFGSLAAEAFLEQFPEFNRTDLVVPSDLGKMKGWSQADYLLFWFHAISGINVVTAREIDAQLQSSGIMQEKGFTDPKEPAENRWNAYEALAIQYAQTLRTISANREVQAHNIQAVLFILDGHLSLGARAEDVLSRKLGILPQYQPVDSVLYPKLNDAYRQYVQELRDLGATAFGTEINQARGLSFVGYGQGQLETSIAFQAGFRKTGLMNALLARHYYTENPEQRPQRHSGHVPR